MRHVTIHPSIHPDQSQDTKTLAISLVGNTKYLSPRCTLLFVSLLWRSVNFGEPGNGVSLLTELQFLYSDASPIISIALPLPLAHHLLLANFFEKRNCIYVYIYMCV